ncbi:MULTISPECIES: site-specific integrase [unclassified Maribacter]|uniref:site-specific integrase n=1 Tax=unclassified Maribacter TaxID=2615042 RepID=UPI000ECCACED|nr:MULTISPECIES: site-specific integrase [unclassified Maribacter]HAI38934.1 recombinase [Maribacter sp.]|tara:strand:+ start:365 stop:1591 length:1227 start_codon:yes stop_codon:yes gene_type:complete
MATLKTVLHTKTDTKGNRDYRLALRLTVNRKRSYYHLGQKVDPKFWDEKAGKVKSSHSRNKQLNRLIRKKYDEIEDIIFEMETSKQNYSAKQIIDSIRKNTKRLSFFELADEHVEDLIKANNHNRAISDRSKINRIKEFAKKRNFEFEEIDENLLKKLKIYLRTTSGLSERSVMNIFVMIRLLYNKAISRKIVDRKFYPFGKDKIKIKYPQTIKIGLDEHEIRKIEELDLDTRTAVWHTRNVFLFSFYLAGIRISDVLRMRWSDIVAERLYYKMSKNDKADSLKLPEPVIKILSHYQVDKKNKYDYIFPELKTIPINDSKAIYSRIKTSIKRLNTNLTVIADLAEIDKKITNHIARHSFGNIASDKVSPQMLQKLYRHTHLSTTIGYQGNFIHKNADEALNAIINFSK